jgi:hypothetical protein
VACGGISAPCEWRGRGGSTGASRRAVAPTGLDSAHTRLQGPEGRATTQGSGWAAWPRASTMEMKRKAWERARTRRFLAYVG